MTLRHDPYLATQFHVELDGVVVGGFAEVSGLDVLITTEVLREGGVNTHIHHLPGVAVYSNVILTRGLGSESQLWSWCLAAAGGTPERKRASVILLENGLETWRWNIRNALPVRWSGPRLSALGAGVAIERLELAHEGIERG